MQLLSFTKLAAIATLVLTFISGCSTLTLNDLFKDYSQQMAPSRNALRTANVEQAQSLASERRATENGYILSLLEKGRIAYLAQNYQQSKQYFEQAYQALEKNRAKAQVQLSSGLNQVGSWVTNDNALNYQVPAYEQSMLHTYQAFNYLLAKNKQSMASKLEAALVEVRRANQVQELAIKQAEAEIADSARDVSTSRQQAGVNLDKRIGDIKNSYENAYTFYLSGLLYEAQGQLNDAYIDYKRALAIFTDNQFLQQDVLRLASKLGMHQDLPLLEKQYGKFQQPVKKAENGSLVVIYEQGLIDAKKEQRLNLPISTRHGDFRTFNMSIPSYSAAVLPQSPLGLGVNNQVINSQQIVQLQALVAKQLEEQMPGIIARQTARLLAKEELRRSMSKEGGDIGNILAGLYSIASERADTRSWLTLPNDVQILKTELTSGQHHLKVSGVAGLNALDIEIKKNRITLVVINQVGQLTNWQSINL